MENNWSHEFTPVERQASVDLENVVHSFDWFIHAGCGLMAFILFVIAANRSKEGDAMGALLASIGAVLSATAPIIAKSFSIGD